MKCPHCLIEINAAYKEIFLGPDQEGSWSIYKMICPNQSCGKMIIDLAFGENRPVTQSRTQIAGLERIISRITIKPFGASRPPVPKAVDKEFADDYTEAGLILSLSPKASAALSRRCLQHILREKGGVKKGELAKEIQQIIDSKNLPSHLAESIDAVRNIGNFAAHPMKSTATGEIVEVEFGEAEWLLDVIEALFDFYFVQPAVLLAKRNALNQKLSDIGKLPMK